MILPEVPIVARNFSFHGIRFQLSNNENPDKRGVGIQIALNASDRPQIACRFPNRFSWERTSTSGFTGFNVRYPAPIAL